MSDNYDNNNRNSNGSSALLKGLIGLAAAGVTAYVAYKKGSAESDKNEAVRRQQADEQEMKRHKAIASDCNTYLEDKSYRELIDICECTICKGIYTDDEDDFSECFMNSLSNEQISALIDYANNNDCVAGFYTCLLFNESNSTEDERDFAEELTLRALENNYPYACILMGLGNNPNVQEGDENYEYLASGFSYFEKNYERAVSNEPVPSQDLFIYAILRIGGTGCDKNEEKAENALRIAAEQGFHLANEALNDLMDVDLEIPSEGIQEESTSADIQNDESEDDWDDVFDELDEEINGYSENENDDEEEMSAEDSFADTDDEYINSDDEDTDEISETEPDSYENQTEESVSDNIQPESAGQIQNSPQEKDFYPVRTLDIQCQSLQDVVMQMRQYDFKGVSNFDIIFFGDAKFNKKISNASRAYAKMTSVETPVCLFDDTVFGSAKEGFVLTTRNLFIRVVLGTSATIPLDSITGVKVKGSQVFIEYNVMGNSQEVKLDVILNSGMQNKAAENMAMLISIALSI